MYSEFYYWMVDAQGLSEKTAYLYDRRMTRAGEWGNLTSMVPLDIAKRVIATSQSSADHNAWYSALRKYQQFFEFKFDTQLDLVSKLQTKAADKCLPKPLTEEEIDRITEAIPITSIVGLRDRAIIEMLYCGLRNNEVCGLYLSSLRDKSVLVLGKGAKERIVPVNDVAWYFVANLIITHYGNADDFVAAGAYGLDFALAVVQERLQEFEYIPIFKTNEGNRMYPRAVREIVYKYAQLAGVARAHPHMFRHCLHPNTRIITELGVVSAEDLYNSDNENRVVSVSLLTGEQVLGKVEKKHKHITKDMLEIWAGGRELICTPEHRLFTLGIDSIEEVYAKDVKKDTALLLASPAVKYTESDEEEEDEFCRFLGYCWGDGTVSVARRGVILTDKNTTFLKFYQELIYRYMGYMGKIRKHINVNSNDLTIYNLELVRYLCELGGDEKSKNLRVPKFLFSSSRKNIISFLAGLYDADGNEGKSIRYFSTSKDFLKDVQSLLVGLGIRSRLHKRYRDVLLPGATEKIKHIIYTLGIHNFTNRRRFIETIPTLKKLEDWRKPHYIQELIPAQKLIEFLYRYCKDKEIYLSTVAEKAGVRYLRRYLTLNINKPSLLALLKALEKEVPTDDIYIKNVFSFYKNLLSREFLSWSRVTKVIYKKQTETVYDFYVPRHHTLITDGIVSHNSFATHTLDAGLGNLTALKDVLGHTKLDMVQKYVLTTKIGRERVRSFHPRQRRRSDV